MQNGLLALGAVTLLGVGAGVVADPSHAADGPPEPQRAAAVGPDAPLTIRIGPFRQGLRQITLGGYDTSERLGGAIERFGTPTRRALIAQTSCSVAWRDLGLSMIFSNFGLANPCSGKGGLAQTAQVGGSRWRAAKGLSPGDSASEIKVAYPQAFRCNRRFIRADRGFRIFPMRPGDYPRARARCGASQSRMNGRWWLVGDYSIVGLEGYRPVLSAVVQGGEIRRFDVVIGRAGD